MEDKEVKNQIDTKKSYSIELLDFVRLTLICFVIVFLCVKFLVRPVTVDGSSMYPNLKDGESGFSNVISTFIEKPSRFDVVVVHYKPTDKLWVKRIIGLPGETIQYKDNKLYVNGKYVSEPFLDQEYMDSQTNNGSINFTDDYGPITLKNNQYLCLGDNRRISYDSRRVGPFKGSDIVSKYVYVLYPFNEMGIIDNGSK